MLEAVDTRESYTALAMNYNRIDNAICMTCANYRYVKVGLLEGVSNPQLRILPYWPVQQLPSVLDSLHYLCI